MTFSRGLSPGKTEMTRGQGQRLMGSDPSQSVDAGEEAPAVLRLAELPSVPVGQTVQVAVPAAPSGIPVRQP
ncbi:MAG: hypothetical protein JXR77_04250 [Lentisphaeria bacterium]|nr:hypothetical protein [Lentisphaeria bacterium]